MRTRPPRAGTIVADIVDLLRSDGQARIPAIHTGVNVRRKRRKLPAVSEASIRGALSANRESRGHGLFKAGQRGLYSLVDD
jgi:hypothetical protein